MIPVETTPGMAGGGWTIVEKVNSCVIYLIHCNNLCKHHNVPPSVTIIKGEKHFQKNKCKAGHWCLTLLNLGGSYQEDQGSRIALGK
jgi:dissimilatory sulfite reductase (desulfoviridin) alpha/beta subunit